MSKSVDGSVYLFDVSPRVDEYAYEKRTYEPPDYYGDPKMIYDHFMNRSDFNLLKQPNGTYMSRSPYLLSKHDSSYVDGFNPYGNAITNSNPHCMGAVSYLKNPTEEEMYASNRSDPSDGYSVAQAREDAEFVLEIMKAGKEVVDSIKGEQLAFVPMPRPEYTSSGKWYEKAPLWASKSTSELLELQKRALKQLMYMPDGSFTRGWSMYGQPMKYEEFLQQKANKDNTGLVFPYVTGSRLFWMITEELNNRGVSSSSGSGSSGSGSSGSGTSGSNGSNGSNGGFKISPLILGIGAGIASFLL